MQNNQTMGFIAAPLLVLVILLAMDINLRRTVGDNLHEAVQTLKEQTIGR